MRRYEWETVRPAAVLKDAERNLWLLYYRNAEGGYGVMVAPHQRTETYALASVDADAELSGNHQPTP